MSGARGDRPTNASPPLLERADQLRELTGYLDEAARGRGCLVLLGGSAGIGKTALTRAFRRLAGERARVLTGACDALSTPQPLAPLLDVAAMIGGDEGRRIAGAESRHERFRAFLDWLAAARQPVLVVFEDVHWADEATLDLLRFLGRRIEATRALLVVTYRSDEAGAGHPLRAVFGDLASLRTTRRIELAPLSEDAVARLAEGSGRDPLELHRLTAGNPFFVTEVLASGGSGIPPTVRDAVLARASRLSPEGRGALDIAAVIGSPAELWLLERLLDGRTAGVEACIDAGMLQADGDGLSFRHEIARETVREALSPPARASLHRAILAALGTSPEGQGNLARLAHHAEEAGDREAVLRYAPAAGERAARLGARREAAAQYARALRFADGLDPARRAELLEAYSAQCHFIGRHEEAIATQREALAIWSQIGDRASEGRNLVDFAISLIPTGRQAEARAATDAAIRVLESIPPGPELARAHQVLAAGAELNRDWRQAIAWADKAIELAERFGHPSALALALNTRGASLMIGGDPRGEADVRRAIELARSAGFDHVVVHGLDRLGSVLGESHEFARAERYISEMIAFARERDLDFAASYALAWQALIHVYLGRWNEAAEIARSLQAAPELATITRIMLLVTLGRLRARRGDPDVWPALDEALALAEGTATLLRLGPVRSARAEAAWLAGDRDRAEQEARAIFDLAIAKELPWLVGELAYWRWKAGELSQAPGIAAEPFALQISGQWQQAAERWLELHCPYEAARALAESDDEDALRRAFEEFDRLGAAPARAEVAHRLRELGARSIPRGARPSTQANPAGLTNRQVEVARLIAAGYDNAAIAGRLFISPKTVEHHISAIFAKLEVDNRLDAVRAIERLGLTALQEQ